MRLYRKRPESSYRNWILSLAIFCTMLGLFWYGFGVASDANRNEDRQVTQSSIQRAVAACYAVEGAYPPDVKYLEDHYGIVINHEKFIVKYELAGSNIMPSVAIFEKGGHQGGSDE